MSKKILWGDFLRAKYCQRPNPIINKWHTGQSHNYKHMMNNKRNIEPHIQWYLNSGTCSFLWDDWLRVGPLAYHNAFIPRLNNMKVSQVLHNVNWDEELVRKHAPHSLVHKILTTNLTYNMGVMDQAIWKLHSSGNFTCSSAWELVRNKRTKLCQILLLGLDKFLSRLIFCCGEHLEGSFLLMKRSKLPTNEKIISFGNDAANCFCCYRPGLDMIDHIFVFGNFAKHVWQYFSYWMGMEYTVTSLQNLLMKWWFAKSKNEVLKLCFILFLS